MSCGIIYKWICVPTKKCYIGQKVIENYDQRINRFLNFNRYYTSYTTNIINKVDAERMKYNSKDYWIYEDIEIINCNTPTELKECLNEREMYYIELFDTYNNGLNSTQGGLGTIGHKRTEIEKEKISKALKGKPKPPRTKEHIKKISDSIKIGFKNGRKVWNSKKIIARKNDEIIGEFDSIRECAKQLNLSLISVQRYLAGTVKHNKQGYTFEYKN